MHILWVNITDDAWMKPSFTCIEVIKDTMILYVNVTPMQNQIWLKWWADEAYINATNSKAAWEILFTKLFKGISRASSCQKKHCNYAVMLAMWISFSFLYQSIDWHTFLFPHINIMCWNLFTKLDVRKKGSFPFVGSTTQMEWEETLILKIPIL